MGGHVQSIFIPTFKLEDGVCFRPSHFIVVVAAGGLAGQPVQTTGGWPLPGPRGISPLTQAIGRALRVLEGRRRKGGLSQVRRVYRLCGIRGPLVALAHVGSKLGHLATWLGGASLERGRVLGLLRWAHPGSEYGCPKHLIRPQVCVQLDGLLAAFELTAHNGRLVVGGGLAGLEERVIVPLREFRQAVWEEWTHTASLQSVCSDCRRRRLLSVLGTEATRAELSARPRR